jgi:PAS domain S-box-containing protein
MSTTRRDLASRSRGFRGEGITAGGSARAGTGAPGILRSGDPGGVRTITLSGAARLAAKVVLVGLICHVSTQIGFAHKIPPHDISSLWPTTAILFSVLVASPVRHWWAYTLAAYASSVVNDIRAGFPASAGLFIAAGILEIAAAAAGVRRFADGLRAFLSLRGLVAYVLIAVILAPAISAFIAAFAGSTGSYWFYWRVWALSEALAYLMLAPAILTWIRFVRDRIASGELSRPRWIEAGLIGCGLIAIGVLVFNHENVGESRIPALVYLPLPFLLWAAVRFRPAGVNTCLLIVACLAISGAVRGRGPFAVSTQADNVLALQLFLVTMSVPLMFLATLMEERRQRASMLSESEARFRSMADGAPVLIWMSGADKRCTFFNKGWLGFTGRTLSKELGEGWSEGVHADDRERRLRAYADAFDERREFTIEYRLRRHDGHYRWILDRGVPRLGSDGALQGYVGCAEDVTELRRATAEIRDLKDRLELENAYLRHEITVSHAHEGIVGESPPIKHVLSQVEQVAGTDSTVLILGETGVGKELVARAIHRGSGRQSRALVKVNCAALPPTLIESELFGREKGAYTGASTRQAGRFEVADRSTIFLDEVGELPLELQAKLLRVLQEGEFERLGSSVTRKVDVRVIAASNRDLGTAVREGTFRADLYYRLRVFAIEVPPLRLRKGDIPLLVWFFLGELGLALQKKIERVPSSVMNRLVAYDWPGNIRELRNVLERALIISQGPVLSLDESFEAGGSGLDAAAETREIGTLERVERDHIRRVLEECAWRVRGPGNAAERLGLNASTLYSRMKKLKIQRAR